MSNVFLGIVPTYFASRDTAVPTDLALATDGNGETGAVWSLSSAPGGGANYRDYIFTLPAPTLLDTIVLSGTIHGIGIGDLTTNETWGTPFINWIYLLVDGVVLSPYDAEVLSAAALRWTLFAPASVSEVIARQDGGDGNINATWIVREIAAEQLPTPPIEPGVVFQIDGGVTFDDLLEAKIRVELNGSGSAHFVLSRSDPQATAANLVRGSVVQAIFPEIDPDPIFEFFLQEGDFGLLDSDEEGGEELSFGGPGTLSYLARAVLDFVEYESGAGKVQLSKGRWRFDENGTEGKIMDKMLREAQSASRPSDPIPGLTWTFTPLVDSAGESWDNEVLEGYWFEKIGTSVLSAILRLVRANVLSVEMAPGLVLHAYRDLGTDRTGSAFGTGVVRFARGVNIADELSRSMAGISFASHGIVRYGDGSYARAVKDGGTPYDQEAYFESNADKAATARRQAKGQMKLREDAQEALIFSHRVPWPAVGNDEGSGVYLPGPSWSENGLYWVGDLVTLHTGTEDFEYDNATKRVYAITLAVDETGYLAPPIVELDAPYRSGAAVNEGLGSITGTTGDVAVIGGSGTVASSSEGGLFWKDPVRCVVTTDVTIVTALNAGDSAGGVTLASGDRVLLIGQADASENGIYQAGDAPSRTSDFDASDEVAGAIVYVKEGTGAGSLYRCTNTDEPVIDTDNLTFGLALVLALDDLSDVNAPSPADGDVLTWDDYLSEWVAAAADAGASPFYDVTAYGATGDGSTDDTVAIEAAIAAADATTGGTIYFPPGVYKITTTITLTGQNYHFLGAGSRYGPSRIHMATANTTALSFAPSGSVALRTKTSLVQNLVVSGPGGASSGRGIDATNDLHVENCFVYGFYDGIYLRSASYYSYIARSTFTDCDRAGLVLDSTNNTTVDTCRFTGAFSGSGAPIGAMEYGIFIGCPFPTGLNTRIINTSIEYQTKDGIYASGLFGGEISGCYFETQQSSTGYAHVNLGPSNPARAVTLTGNCFQGDGTSGFVAIRGGTTDRITVAGNYFGVNSAIDIEASAGTNSNWLLVNNYNNPAGTFNLPTANYTLDPASPPISSGATPGGELGGTWASPTVDATHAGSTHLALGTTSTTAAAGDHVHADAGSELLISDSPSTPLVFADLVQTEDQDDLVYAD